jgi:hypothetical protein
MSELAVVDSEPFKEMEAVAKIMLKGHSEFKAARDLGLKVVEVKALWQNYKERLDNDMMAKDAARDHLNLMVKQYDDLIQKLHANLDDLSRLDYDEKISAQINATTKNIADFQAKRVDLLQKAGLLDAHDLGDELAEREEREALLINILRNDLCPECRMTVARRLQEVTNTVEATVVYND